MKTVKFQGDADRSSFLREVNILDRLGHPNIARFFGAALKKKKGILVLALLPCSLADVLYEEGHQLVLNMEEKRRMSMEVASGMLYLHTTRPRVVHGDLKPANVMLDERGTCKIIDFGLAQVKMSSRKSTKMTANTGTLPYMAPELFDVKGKANHLVDNYAFGVTVCELFTAVSPFCEVDTRVLPGVIQSGERPSVDAGAGLPEDVKGLVQACWDANPKRRPEFKDIVAGGIAHKLKEGSPGLALMNDGATLVNNLVFLSLRFGEAMEEAVALKDALCARGLNVFLCNELPGSDLMDAIVENISSCALAIILGTGSYGVKGSTAFSTKEELKFIVDRQKPIFLVKMCDDFEAPLAQFALGGGIAYHSWRPQTADEKRSPPTALVESIMTKLRTVISNNSSRADVSTASTVAAAINPHGAPTRSHLLDTERERREQEEAERKRREAEEAERKRQAQKEAERKRREAEEAERKRQTQEEAERKRREQEEAERKRRQTSHPPNAVLRLVGAGEDRVNGYYEENGSYNDKPQYLKVSKTTTLRGRHVERHRNADKYPDLPYRFNQTVAPFHLQRKSVSMRTYGLALRMCV